MAKNHVVEGDSEHSSGLSVPNDKLNDFISDLLGKKQSISRARIGILDVDLDWLINTVHTINQRVISQNHAKLTAFSCEIFLDDGLKRELNSIEELETYNERRNSISRGVKLNFVYLIKFPSKDFPEKQEIEFFVCDSQFTEKVFSSSSNIPGGVGKNGFVAFGIMYSERTWGDDLESLIRDHVDKTVGSVSKFRRFFSRFSLSFSAFVMLASLTAPSILNQEAVSRQRDEIWAIISTDSFSLENKEQLRAAYESSIDLISSLSSNYMDVISLFLGLVISIIIISWSGKFPRSFVSVTEAAKRYREKKKGQDIRGYIGYAVSFTLAVLASVIGNYFYYLN